MISLVADANIQGHVSRLLARMQGEAWRLFWDHLQIRCLTFADLGLDAADKDSVVWQRCQEQGVCLLTNNRHEEGDDSLETTIRQQNTPASLPVFTLGDADAVLASSEYADRVIDKLFRYLLDIDNVRGTGRLYLP